MTSLSQSALITIGIDPHPGSHTACALDSSGGTLATLTVQNDPEGLGQLMAWCHCFPNRRFAIEGLGNSYIYPLVLDLLRQGETVYSIPPAMTAQYRSRRGRKKNDVVDAENVARALLANPDLPAYEAAPQQRALQELSRSYRRLSSELKANKMSLEVTVTPEVRQALQAVTATLQSALRQLLRVMEAQVKQLAPGLLRLTGVGPVVATTVLAEVGMLSRFSSRDDYAAYSGCAPVTRASGAYQLVQVNTRGNRRLNWAMHIVVQTRLRLDERSRVYRAKKLAEGKTQREVIRCLKTYVSREIYRVLQAEQASSAPTRPSHSSREMAASLGPCS